MEERVGSRFNIRPAKWTNVKRKMDNPKPCQPISKRESSPKKKLIENFEGSKDAPHKFPRGNNRNIFIQFLPNRLTRVSTKSRVLPNHNIRRVFNEENSVNNWEKILPNISFPIQGSSPKRNIPLLNPLILGPKQSHLPILKPRQSKDPRKNHFKGIQAGPVIDQKSTFNLFPIIVLNPWRTSSETWHSFVVTKKSS